jgi:glutamate-1-semialdehyde 2,1-aminomutase
MIAGTYNGHPVPMAAAIATMKKLRDHADTIYPYLERLGAKMEQGLTKLLQKHGITAVISRQGSAFCVYFMRATPQDWHIIAEHHDMARDLRYRQLLIDHGIYNFPLPTKQGSISAAHTDSDIDGTLEITNTVLAQLNTSP